MILREPLEYPPGAGAVEIVQRCWNILEKSIREQPECWLWSYKHWRFRPFSDSSGRYPFYAQYGQTLRQASGPAILISSGIDPFEEREFPLVHANHDARLPRVALLVERDPAGHSGKVLRRCECGAQSGRILRAGPRQRIGRESTASCASAARGGEACRISPCTPRRTTSRFPRNPRW